MAEIKAIETVYNGYRFRSRLEARWAVFFDAANISYEYEIEGYVLRDGTRYLPDFYLPEYGIYVEIKPDKKDVTGQERRKMHDEWEDKCRKFRDSVGKAIYLQIGDPTSDLWGVLFAFETNDEGGGAAEYSARFASIGYDDNPTIILCVSSTDKNTTIMVKEWESNDKVLNISMFVDKYWEEACGIINLDLMCHQYNPNGMIKGSYDSMRTKARQARFEYGECGM